MRGANAQGLPPHEREQQQRYPIAVIGDNDERLEALLRTDQPLPGTEEIEPLLGGGKILLIFEASPHCLGLVKIGE